VNTARSIIASLASLALLLACDTQTDQPLVGLQAHSFANSEWSVPVRLDAPVNSPTANEQGPALSSHGLALYFCSNRPPSGGNDLWVSRRASDNDPWGDPVNLGSTVNSSGGDCGPSLFVDGLLLFFTSNRTGGAGGNDIYVTSRTDATDDLSWGAPVRLGPDINTTAAEFSPFITKPADHGTAELYFERGSSNTATDIFVVTIDAQGTTLGPAVPVTELNSSDADGHPTVRFDGREMLLQSNRDGRGGNFDLFVSTRRSPHDLWSTPQPVAELSVSPMHEIFPYLSKDGRTVFFVRGTGVANDIWMATRTPSGH
jgi:Tol biopolymer transport system component